MPLLRLRVHGVRMNSDLGEERVEEPQEAWVARAQGLLKEC